MEIFDYSIKLPDREIAILNDLYDYRVMTTNQIKKRHFTPNQYRYADNVLWKMRKNKLIKSSTLKGSRKGKKGFSYHRLTETGLEHLAKCGRSVEGQSSLYVKPRQVPYLLMLNDLVVELGDEWEIWDSRRVKKEYNLDSRMNIQGLAISPDKKKYGLYVLDKNVTEQTIGKIHSEIKANAGIGINDFMIITKGGGSYHEFIKQAITPKKTKANPFGKRLYTGHAIKVYPYGLFILKAQMNRTESEWIRKLCAYYGFKIRSMEIPDGERQSFPVIVEYQGKEMYLVDITDSDLNKYYKVKEYNDSPNSRRWENNRRVLAITLGLKSIANDILDKLPFVDHRLIGMNELHEISSIEINQEKPFVNS